MVSQSSVRARSRSKSPVRKASPKRKTSPARKASPKRKTSPKRKSPKSKPAQHPPTLQMVRAAIKALKDPKGTSVQAIKKYILANFKGVRAELLNSNMRKAIAKGVSSGALIRPKKSAASGATGRLRLGKMSKTAVSDFGDAKPKKTKKKRTPKKTAKKAGKRKSPKKKRTPAAKKAKKPAAKKTKAKPAAAAKKGKAKKKSPKQAKKTAKK